MATKHALILTAAVGITAQATLSTGGGPETIVLSGIVRDFQERSEDTGHVDFERRPLGGFGLYANMVANDIGPDGNPVYQSTGQKVRTQASDAQGRAMMFPRDYIDAMPGDEPGRLSSGTGAVTSAESFSQWFKDIPGVNISQALSLTFVRQANSNVYVFDDKLDPSFASLGGFFPINGELYGNSAGNDRNFHFTFELETTFTYDANAGYNFKFVGDDDVWVFIDGKLVIDLGGVHGATAQSIDLDRLNWLEDGKTYSLKFFFAERHRTQSNFRIETTIPLVRATLPSVSALFD
jgi:fibro-slime domain-containing protein